MRHGLGWYGAAVAFVFGVGASAAQAQLMIVGNDEKITFDENNKAVNHEPGKDSVSIVDISKPDAPKIVATFPLANSIVGPPTNLAIHPSGEIALIANSVNPEKEGDVWKNVPDDKISVIDLKASPPKVIATVNAGKQASGMAIACMSGGRRLALSPPAPARRSSRGRSRSPALTSGTRHLVPRSRSASSTASRSGFPRASSAI